MEERELETLLHHLGQDIAYMGHCVQKDVQKCLKDLTATHDQKRFCNKLTGILKKFSEYTIQYSKDLEGRIKDYNKEEEYRDITTILQEIATKTVTCHRCETKEKLVESSTSLGLPSNNNADEASTKYLKNEVLSQCSLHIGGEDEIKSESEQCSQPHSSDIQNEDVTSANEEGRPTQQEPEISSVHDNYDWEQEAENHRAGSFDNDTDVANSLEISHSEEIPSVEDEEEVTVCISGDTPDNEESTTFQNNILTVDTVENLPIPLPYKPIFEKDENVNLDNAVEFDASEKLQKFDVIPLPYKPISEKENLIEESGDLNAQYTSSENADNPCVRLNYVTGRHDFNEVPKLNVIALPYKPIFELEKPIEKSVDSDVVSLEGSISSNGAKSSSLEGVILEEKNTSSTQNDSNLLNLSSDNLEPRKGNIKELHTDEIDDSNIEIVSVASSNDENDSDVEIIENILPAIINISDLDCASNNYSQGSEEKINSHAETVVKSTSPRTSVVLGTLSQGHSSEETVVARTSNIESQNTEENVDSDAETVKNTSPRTALVLGTLPQGHSSEETVVAPTSTNESQNTEENVDSDAETVKNTSPRTAAVLGTLSQEHSSEETVVAPTSTNESQNTEENLDSDAETVKNTSPRTAVVLGILSQGHSSEETVVAPTSTNESQNTEENVDSDAETVKNTSPRTAAVLGTLSQGHSSEETVVARTSINESQSTEENLDTDAETIKNTSPRTAVVFGTLSQGHSTEEIIVARTVINESQSINDKNLVVYSKETEDNHTNDSDDTIIASPLDEAALLDGEENYKTQETPNVTKDSDTDAVYLKASQKNLTVAQKSISVIDDLEDMNASTHMESSVKEDSNHSTSKDNHRAITGIETQNDKTVLLDGDGDSIGLTGEKSVDSPEVATQDIEISQTKSVLEGEHVVMEDCEVDMLSQESYVFDLATEQDSEEIVPRQSPGNDQIAEVAIVDEDKDLNEIFERENTQVSPPQVVPSDSTTLTDNKNENLSECGDINDDENSSISELSESEASSATLATTSAKTKKKLKEKDRKSLLKVIAEYFLKRTRENAGISKENEDNNKDNTKKEFKKSRSVGIYRDSKTKEKLIKGSAGNRSSKKAVAVQSEAPELKNSHNLEDGFEDPDMTQKVYDIRKLKGVSSAEINDNDFKQPNASSKNSTEQTENYSKNKGIDSTIEEVVSPFKRKTVRPLPSTQSDEDKETEHEENDVVSPFKKKAVKRLHTSDESDSEPPKKISEVNESDISDGQIVKPFKRKRVNRLQSTDDDESDGFKKTSEEDSDIEHGPKRKRALRLIISEQNSPDDVVIDQNDGQEMIAANDRNSQFKLDDKARDDFLDLFDQPAEDPQSSASGGLEEETREIDRDGDSDNEYGNVPVEASQFRLSDCDRDNLLNLLTDKENDDRMRDKDQRLTSNLMSRELQDNMLNGSSNSSSENNSATNEPLNTLHAEENAEDLHDGVGNMPSQFKLDSKARDEFLDLLNSEPTTQLEHTQDKNKEAECNSNEEKPTSDKDSLIRNSDKQGECIESNQFQLSSADRDDLLELLTNDESRAEEHKQDNNGKKNEGTSLSAPDIHKTERDDSENDEIEPSQFKLNDKARDDFLDMLNGDQSDDSTYKFEEKRPPSAASDNTDRPKVTSDSNTYSKENNDKDTTNSEDVDLNGDKKGTGEAMDVGEDEIGDEDYIDDAATENSQGIDDFDESEEDGGERIDDGDDEIDNASFKTAEFKLNESERDELLILLSDHIKKREMASSESECDEDPTDKENGMRKKNKRKSKKVDRDMLLELLQEYERAVTGKDKALVENIKNGDMEFANMDSENEKADSDFGEDSAADSESVLMDLLREETVEEPGEGQRRKKVRNNSKEAWNAYRQLLKDSEELSDTSSELSDIDIEDFELDLSDQERKHKEKELHDHLRKKFNIEKELIVNLEQASVTQFDLSLLQRKAQNSSSIDRLCDISNVLRKRKKVEQKKQPKVKLKRRSPSVSSSESECSDSDSRSSSCTRWSEYSLKANQDSSSPRDSPFLHLSDDNEEQEKLANTLWENIKNSSDEHSGWSSDSETSDDEDKKKKGKGGRGGGKKGKKKKGSDGEGKSETGDDTSSEKSGSEDGDGRDDDESGDREEAQEGGAKDAELDSSDEEDFVGVRKSKGAWKHDPLLKSCFTSDEDSDSDSADASPKKARSGVRSKRRSKRKVPGNEGLVAEKDGTPTEDTGNSTDSDVEFIMEKQKTPKKVIEIADEVEDESPSKRGAGRRNIRALFEDDELAEATKKAKKEETERIKRLQERERAKETFTQSQSFGSQLSEDESDPLILDVNENLQIKVHPKITKKLKPHQRTGIQFMWDSCYESVEQLKKGYEGSGCILAHCMGLGKTLQALGLIHTLFDHKEITKTKHVLVVCPLSTVSNWRNEFRLAYKDVKHCKVHLYTIQDKKVFNQRCKIVGNWWRTGGVLVMGYECFGIMINDQKWDKWEKTNGHEKKDVLKALVNPGPDLVICDEGHLLRNKQTQRTLALNRIETKRRIVLTGTPLQNNLLEYYYMVNFVKPNLLGTEKEFKTNFINPISNGQFENSTAIDILFMKKRTHVLHKILNKTVQRVEDTELKKYLPELVDHALFVKLSDLQIGFYNTYLDAANSRPVEYTAAGNISRKNFLADIQILRYICTHPDVVTIAKRSVKSRIREQDVIDDILDDGIDAKVFSKGDWYKDLVPESGVKKLELGTKMTVTLGIVKEAIANNDKVLIFSQTHAEMDSLEFFLKQELAYKKGVDYNRMDGTISPEVRTHMCDTFNKKNNKKLRVFIMSTKVGGLGLNLTAASRVILMNVNWNPSYDTQSVFRAFRFGQNKAVYVYRLIALGTMEEKMYQRQVTKLAVAHRVVDKHQITRHYSAADIQEFYSARPSVEGERPLPNVPEDRVLAKLIQKYQFLYKWHEHQALLANRPEEDLNEQQKNAAWEEFNKKAVEPPPPLPSVQPQFVNVGNLLNQPGPSGLQNVNLAPGYQPALPRPNKRPRARRSPRLNKVPDPLQAMSNYVVPKTFPVIIRQTESGPKLLVQTDRRMPGKEIPLRLGYSTPLPVVTGGSRPSMTVSVIDPNRGIQSAPVDVTRDEDAARKIHEINSLISAQTAPDFVSGFNTTITNPFTTNTADVHSSRIDEINSLTSAILSQHDDLSASSQEWAEDGMNNTLLSVHLPDDDTEDSTSGHFADHSYSLPKANLLNFTTPSAEDFLPMPSPKFIKIPCPLFVDVNAPLDLDHTTRNIKHNKYRLYKRYSTAITQRTNSADDFRATQAKYVPRPLFVDVQAPLGPRPNLSGLNPPHGQKSRASTTSKPVQNQVSTNSVQNQSITSLAPPQQVRLGNAITITHNNGPKTNPPPAHAQTPSISIIPQPASTRTISNTPPRPYVPKSSSNVVQNPLNLTRNRQIVPKKQPPTRNEVLIQKEKNNLVIGPTNDAGKSKQAASSTQKIVTTLPPKIVVAPPLRMSTAPPHLVKQVNKNLPSRPVTLPTSPATLASEPVPVSTPTTTTPAQQSPLQKQMRNFMEHLHHLQLRMKSTEEKGANNLGDSNLGHVWNPTGTNQGTPANINTGNRPNNSNVPITRNTIVGGAPSTSNPLPSRTTFRVGPNNLSPVIGRPGTTTNVAGLNAARNLSNITKTYQKSQNNKGLGVPLLPPATSQSPAHHPRLRVVGTLPTTNTSTVTSKVIMPKNTGSNITYTNGNSPTVVRKMITTNPRGVPKNVVINPTRHATNGNIPRVITKIVDPRTMGTNARVRLLNGGDVVPTKATRIVPEGTRISPVLSGHKEIVISHKEDAQQVPANPSPLRFDLLQKKIVASLNKYATNNLPPKQLPTALQASRPLPPSLQRLPVKLPSAPQRSFNNGTNMKTYQASKKNNTPSRSSSLPSLPQSAFVSKSNKENRAKRKLTFRTNNNMSSASIDLSNDEDNANNSSGSLPRDMVNTLKKKGVSVNYVGKGNEKGKVAGL